VFGNFEGDHGIKLGEAYFKPMEAMKILGVMFE